MPEGLVMRSWFWPSERPPNVERIVDSGLNRQVSTKWLSCSAADDSGSGGWSTHRRRLLGPRLASKSSIRGS
jgi:hypothetical protein